MKAAILKTLAGASVAALLMPGIALAQSQPASGASAAQTPAPAAAGESASTGSQAPLSDPAAKQIRSFYDTLLSAMKHAKSLGVKGRYKKLEPAVDKTFDFPVMTKLAIGPDWTKMSDAEHKQLIDAFRRLTIADYAHNFDGYGGESFTVSPKVQERAGDKIVDSQMMVPGKQAIPFVYRMHQGPHGWGVIDIYLNGYVSEVATRRADFASTLKSGGATALATKLNQLADEALKE